MSSRVALQLCARIAGKIREVGLELLQRLHNLVPFDIDP